MTQPDPATTALLLRAADELELHGHMSWSLGTTDGRMCVAGALNVAEHGYPEYEFHASNGGLTPAWFEAFAAVRDVLGIDPNPGFVTRLYRDVSLVVNWNNAYDRTGAEVVDALRRAAATASPPDLHVDSPTPPTTPEDAS